MGEGEVIGTEEVMDTVVPSHYVGVGASAGGLEAIEEFFSAMPVDTGLAFVVIQHLSPDYKSLMVELLAKRTTIPVKRAEDGMKVLPDHIYLIPPQKNLRIFHGKLILIDQDHRHGPVQGLNLPIDIFLRSLAEDQGDRAIAVILSGTGSDGTRGVSAVKEAGGMVMVQDPETARFDGMPKSAIATGLADFVLPPREMPAQLQSYVLHPFAKQGEGGHNILSDEDGLSRIFSLLRDSSKVDFTFYKPSTMIRRIERRMSLHQVHELQDYVSYLEDNPAEVTALYRELLIGVTNFFRDPEAFEILRRDHLPQIFETAGGRELRFWVAGCSTGQEAYSLAIASQELMAEMGVNRKVRIFATDVDRDAIEQASVGVYPDSVAADMPGNIFSKYFTRQGDFLQISRQIRGMVVFAHHNLVKDPPFTNIDLVSCRNLLIYLQPVLQRKVLEYFNFSLGSSGLLFLGASETVGEMSDYFKPMHQKWRIYQAKGKRHITSMLREPMASRSQQTHSPLQRRNGIWRSQEEERALDRLLQGLGGDLLPLTLLINDHLELLHVVGDSHPFLRVPSGKAVNDLSKNIADELVIPLTTGVLRLLKQEEPHDVLFTNIKVRTGEEVRLVNMRLRLLPQRKGQEPLVAVIIDSAQHQPCLPVVGEGENYDLDKEAEQRIADLEQELQFTRENLQATIEELETSNEELQATNEELLASNEELQSTNEELQSVNEELFTVNSEYQTKINELTQVNNDYDNLLASMDLPIMFLDENKKVRRVSGPLTELLSIGEGDVDRPLSIRSQRFAGLDMERVVDEVIREQSPRVMEIRDSAGRWYLLRVMPYRVGDNVFSGVVMIFMDINRCKAGEEALQWNEERTRFMTKAVGVGLWDWDILSGEISWSETIEPLFGLKSGEFGGTYQAFLECVHPEDRERVQTAVDDALAGKRAYQVVHRVIWPDGTVHQVEESGKVLTDSDGKPLRMLGVTKGVDLEQSAQRMLEDKSRNLQQTSRLLDSMQSEVKRRDRLFREFLELVPVPVGLVRDTVIEWVNGSFEKLTGYRAEELKGSDICRLIDQNAEDIEDDCRGMLHAAVRGTEIVPMCCKDGRTLRFEVTSVPLDAGDPAAGSALMLREVGA